MSAVTDLRDALLGMVGVENSTHAGPILLQRVLNDINAAREEMATLGPLWWTRVPSGAYTKAQTALTGMTLTQDSKTVTGTGFASWMNGCTVQVVNQSFQNQLVAVGAGWELVIPWGSATVSGTGTAVVYSDCVPLDSGVFEVIAPIELAADRRLYPITSNAQLVDWTVYGTTRDYGAARYMPQTTADREIDTPDSYLIETLRNSSGFPRQFIRLNPIPPAAYPLKFFVRKLWPAITDLTSDTTAELCPYGFDQTILYPIARKRFSGYHLFEGDQAQIDEQYQRALAQLDIIREPQTEYQESVSNGGVW